MSTKMTTINPISIAAYVLAGGESRRFGGNITGKTKAMQAFKGFPLITHTIARLKAQVDCVNINTHLPGFDEFKCPIVGDDPTALYQGPLSGLLASMRHLHSHYPDKEWLLLAPCDSPFLPKDLVQTLVKDINTEQHLAACISYQGELQPTFSLWHKNLLSDIQNAVTEKQWGGLKIFFNHLENAACVVEYTEQQRNPFLNINNRDELSQAEKLSN